jgi:hypothetical protein
MGPQYMHSRLLTVNLATGGATEEEREESGGTPAPPKRRAMRIRGRELEQLRRQTAAALAQPGPLSDESAPIDGIACTLEVRPLRGKPLLQVQRQGELKDDCGALLVAVQALFDHPKR